ncbi:hypothetical protein EK0264_08865 [Epidermidibacterium keratini]|uniref:Uncharacterized protein n=1 Tax=Epidermidibacterium keratini TaxID=1891644 RepID=A0A7L4YM74_9ACTN|nr:hypothetical protein [Epidermidibacterium keratini]QHC00381.1 hypothetical protein EK0264_08865 [Epidermidibacterium keratini]
MSTTPSNASGRANRVAPDGSLHAAAARGTFWGNRGQLLNRSGSLARQWNGRLWIICQLEFNGRHRTQWQPGRLTELYFLDEPTALAAGHRPCGECRHADYVRFKEAWLRAHPASGTTAGDIDLLLHASRLDARSPRVYEASRDELPDDVMVRYADHFWRLVGDRALRWTWSGYDEEMSRAELPSVVTVQTPAATVAVLAAGYRPSTES